MRRLTWSSWPRPDSDLSHVVRDSCTGAQPQARCSLQCDRISDSGQDAPQIRLGSGLTDAELGLRLRYEISRQFAPYIGVSYEAKTGRTADFVRADGKDPTTTSFVAGMRFWF